MFKTHNLATVNDCLKLMKNIVINLINCELNRINSGGVNQLDSYLSSLKVQYNNV